MKCLNKLQIRGQAFAMIGARSSRYTVAFCLAASQSSRARLQLATESKFANFQSHTQSSHPHPPQHCRLRVVGIETSRTESRTEEPPPESNNLVMSRRRTGEMIISPCVGVAPSLNVCTSTRKNRNCCAAVHSSIAVIGYGFWAHIGSIP